MCVRARSCGSGFSFFVLLSPSSDPLRTVSHSTLGAQSGALSELSISLIVQFLRKNSHIGDLQLLSPSWSDSGFRGFRDGSKRVIQHENAREIEAVILFFAWLSASGKGWGFIKD